MFGQPVLAALLVIAGTLSLFRMPFFENDMYRYFIDGMNFLKEGTVYTFPPSEAWVSRQEEFSFVIRNVGFPNLATIYPPVTVLFFATVALFSAHSFTLFCLLLRLFAIAAIILTAWVAGSSDDSWEKRLGAIFLLISHPFINLELIVNQHFDVLVMVACVFFLCRRTPSFLEFVCWAGSFKIVPALPFVAGIKMDAVKRAVFRPSLGILALCYVVSLAILRRDLLFFYSNWRHAVPEWEMNAGIFRWLRRLLVHYFEFETSQRLSYGICVALYLVLWSAVGQLRRKKDLSEFECAFVRLFSLPLFSQVCNPWYFVWGFPLLLAAPFSKRIGLFMMSLAPLQFYYLYYILDSGLQQEAGPWLDFEHIATFSLIGFALLKSDKGLAKRSLRSS